jgi:ankyrin repeat protein
MVMLILILVLAVLTASSSCSTTPKTKDERESVNQEVFFYSVKNGDYAEVKRLIEAGADVNAQTNEGFTALIIAPLEGRTEVVKLLREAGVEE